MSVEAVLERIEQEPITIDLENGRLRVRTLEAAPADYSLPTDLVGALRDAVESLAIPESLREFTEGVRRLNAQRHLDQLAKDRSFSDWQRLHGWVIKHWPTKEYYFCGYAVKRGHPAFWYDKKAVNPRAYWFEYDNEGEVTNALTYFGKPKEDPFLRNAWSNLCSWADAHLHVAKAKRDLANRTLNQQTLGGARADLTWNSGRLEAVRDSVIWYAMFDEEFYQLLIGIKL